jgi:hypothetical protein
MWPTKYLGNDEAQKLAQSEKPRRRQLHSQQPQFANNTCPVDS